MSDRDQAMSKGNDSLPTSTVTMEEIQTALNVDEKILTIAQRNAEEAAFRRAHVVRSGLTVIVLLVLVISAVFFISRSQYAKDVLHANLWFILLSGVLGASVGTAELVSRYRDEPMQALRSAPALTYLTLNALVSVSIYGLLTHYTRTLDPGLAKDALMRSIVAGFGAMAILRSKFFTLRTEKNEDIGIGPDAAISAFLSAADRGVDRARAKRRLDLVFKSASRVSRVANIKDFIKVSLLSFQNLTGNEKDEINKRIDDIYEDDNTFPSPELKLQAICYAVLIIVGEYNFNKLINNLADFVIRQGQNASERTELAKKTSEDFFKVVKSRSDHSTADSPAAQPGPAAPDSPAARST